MLSSFVGRRRELAALRRRLDRVRDTGRGVAVALRGRRQVGKSRLIQEFCDQSGVPYVFYAATKGASPVESVEEFLTTLRESQIVPSTDAVAGARPGSWPDAFRSLASALPRDKPSIVVLDEVPWLAEQDGVFDGAVQTAWDRLFANLPVLLLLLGSDLHMMERFTSYERPFHGRADTMVLGPLNPAETASVTGLAGADALDAYLVSGGLPGVLRAWPAGTPALDLLHEACEDPASPVFGVGEEALASGFPAPDQSRRVLEAVGSGERTHANIAAAAGGAASPVKSGVLSPILLRLESEKRVLAVDEPLSTSPSGPKLYRVADSNLRLHLAVLGKALEESRRGRPDLAFRRISRSWTSWRGRAIEPVVREALSLAAAAETIPWPEADNVGGWWNRRFDPELDLIGADRAPVAKRVFYAGSVKWLSTPFEKSDFDSLAAGARLVPGFEPGTSGLIVVSLSGATDHVAAKTDLLWGADDVLTAWQL
jgi:hypothetical protein